MIIGTLFKDEDCLADFIDSNNYTWRGGFSEVYDTSCLIHNTVLKVTNDLCYMKYVDLALSNKYLKSVPVIYDVLEINGCFYIWMEKLIHSNFMCATEAGMRGWYDYGPAIWRCLGDNNLNSTLDLLESAHSGEVKWDLRDSNIMERCDGTLVVIDPWSEESY